MGRIRPGPPRWSRTMTPRRRFVDSFRLDLAACVLLVCGLLVAVSIFSADPSETDLAATANLLGPAGAWVAGQLLATLGVAVYTLLASWFVLVVLLFLRESWWTWSRRLAGWVLLVPCAAVIADGLGPRWFGGPLTGSGGSLGAWLAFRLAEQFTPAGRISVLAGTTLFGVLLAADAIVFGATRRLGRAIRRVWWRLNAPAFRWPRPRIRPRLRFRPKAEPPIPAAPASVSVVSTPDDVPIRRAEPPPAAPVEE